MKRLFALLSLMVILSLLAACGGTPETIIQTVEVEKKVVETVEVEKEVTVIETVEVEKEVTVIETVEVEVEVPVEATQKPLVMWASYDLTDTENPTSVTLNQAINTFQAATGIEVEYEQVAWDQLSTKLAVQAQSGGDMPDVVETSSQHALALINAGALMDIADMVAEAPWYDQLNPSEAQACVLGGERYCVAADIRGGAWYYDVADFPNGWPATADAWLEEGERLSGDKFVSTFFAGRHYGAAELTWGPWFYSNGGSIFDEEGKPDWASPENAEVVEWARELLASGYVPETVFTGDFTAGETPWVDGSAASVRGGSWSYLFIPGLQDKYEAGETALGLAPSFGGGPNYVFLVGEGWGVADGSENPGGAMAWINFFMNPQILAQWASQHYGIPTIDEAFKSSAFDNEFYKASFENLGANGIFIEPSEFYVESLTKLSETLQELMLDPDMDAMEALQEAQDEIINRYW
jgi:ABC-type glycerol-3-phosphate transport system substrate-binding protein